MKYQPQQVCAGYLPAGMANNTRALSVSACRAIKLGTGGQWAIDSFGQVPEDQRLLTLTPGPGTFNETHVMTFGVSAGGAGSLVITTMLDGISTDLPFYFKLERRLKG